MDPGVSTSKNQIQIVPRKEKFEEISMTEDSDLMVLKLFLQT